MTRSILVLAALLLGSVVLLLTVALPSDNLTSSALQNFGHFALFAILGFLVLRQLRAVFKEQIVRAVLLSTVCLVLLGLMVEWIQTGIDGRTASVKDFVLDIGGMLAGYLTYWSRTLWVSGRWRASLTALLMAIVLLFIASRSLLVLVGFDFFRPPLPVVRVFDQPFSHNKLELVGAASTQLAVHGQDGGGKSLRVLFGEAKYSGVIFHEDGGQWSQYEVLRIKVFNSLQHNRQIELRIEDRLHNNRYSDRYNRSFSILPGLNELRVPLESLVQMGQGSSPRRELDIDDVSRIQIFASEIEKPFTLDILRIELF